MADLTARSDSARLARHLQSLAGEYPAPIASILRSNIERIVFDLSLISAKFPKRGCICDVGGGLSSFAVLCADVGYDVTVVDDYGDETYRGVTEASLAVHRRHGVQIKNKSIVDESVFEPNDRYDAITLFHVIEHLHKSPKALLQDCLSHLNPGGLLLIAVPNCVNLRKRLTVPLGYGKWSPLRSWYEEEIFRSHVREPDVDDLYYIARDLGVTNYCILGRNFLGLKSRSRIIALAARLLDPLLRFRPSLCSDLYLIIQIPLSVIADKPRTAAVPTESA